MEEAHWGNLRKSFFHLKERYMERDLLFFWTLSYLKITLGTVKVTWQSQREPAWYAEESRAKEQKDGRNLVYGITLEP